MEYYEKMYNDELNELYRLKKRVEVAIEVDRVIISGRAKEVRVYDFRTFEKINKKLQKEVEVLVKWTILTPSRREKYTYLKSNNTHLILIAGHDIESMLANRINKVKKDLADLSEKIVEKEITEGVPIGTGDTVNPILSEEDIKAIESDSGKF